MDFISELKYLFSQNTNEANSAQMQSYMKGLFPFLGIKAPIRQSILKKAWSNYRDEVNANVREIVETLYALDEREYHYSAIEILDKTLKKTYKKEDLDFIKALIYTKSHWDSVDFIAKHILGNYLLKYWDTREDVADDLSQSENMWLNRSAILFQLGYKTKTDHELLFKYCLAHRESTEFFIQKAIGWALREYGKTNPTAVIDFVAQNELKPLSHREALKRLL